ncbi:MAG: Type I Iterative PKS [Chaenotheca gracillima]|nr:MAG: Type I Iterative PKS [Chaenotheca gracillima]
MLVAFRTGLHATEVRDQIDSVSDASTCWSVVVPGMKSEVARSHLDLFLKAEKFPSASRPYVSAVTSNSVTVSGPPKIIERLLNSEQFAGSKSARVQIHAPYHAAHLYNDFELDEILSHSPKDILSSYEPKIPLISTATGIPLSASDFGSLLRLVLAEILLKPLEWDKVIDGCASIMRSSAISTCTIIPIATSASQSLATGLRTCEDLEVKLEDKATPGNQSTSAEPNPTGRLDQSKIAIVGYSGRFPDAPSAELFWDLLYKGLDVHREVPPDRFDVKTHVDPTGKKKNTSQTPYGCWINEPGLFDASFFHMSPREAAQADPAQRLAIVTAYEALEMSGFVSDRTPSTQRDRVGIFYGMTSDDWREVNSGQNVDTYFIPGGNRAFTPGRINYHFKFNGPSYSVDTACSSSLAAIHLACNSLWRGDCDSALAGGTNILTNPDNFAGLDRGHFLSRTGNCNAFDDGADGYCRADGVASLVLKRLEDAIADNDPIQGVIVGAGTNHSAEAVSITRPHAGAQEAIFEKLLSHADLDPHDVSYVEMHGTGTQAGDGVEMRSVLGTFAPDQKRRPHQTLHLGSAKANIGHGESASGATSVVKVLLMMQNNLIPPHCGIKTKINHTFPTDLRERNVHIAMKPTPWMRPEGGKRKVFVNNFSAAGGNTALLIEDAPVSTLDSGVDARSTHIVAASARSVISLKKNIQSLIAVIEESTATSNADFTPARLSYTTTARRAHLSHRILVRGSTLHEIKEALQDSALREDLKPVPAAIPKVAFAFTGQGSHYAGMGSQLFESFSQFRSDIRRFDSIGKSQGFPSMLPLIDGSAAIEELSPLVVQLGSTCVQMALARLWASWGVKPSAVIGHSLGEYAALNVAGVLTASDTIFLAGKRAQLLEEQCTPGTHCMLAIRGSLSSIQRFLDGKLCEVACINAPEETVISGTGSDIDVLAAELAADGIKATKLNVSYAFHSAQVQPILERFEAAAQSVTFGKPSIPIISPLYSQVITETEALLLGPKYLSRHCRETVNFLGALEAARYANIITDKTIWVEVGSHSVCSGMIKSIFGSGITTLPSLRRKEDTWKTLTSSLSALHLAGTDVRWNEYHQDFKGCQQVLRLPAYSWNNKTHWIQYVHDWCLTKGDAPSAITLPEPAKSTRLTTSVQKLVEETHQDNTATVVMESDLADPDLNPVLEGHQVNGTWLCPSSLYADVAQTLCEYLIGQYRPKMKDAGLDVCDVVIEKPLIFKRQGKQLFRASATADWGAQCVKLLFYSVNAEGKKTLDHAKCSVKLGDAGAWLKEFQRNMYFVKRSIESLEKGVDNGQSHKIKRGMAYKLFAALMTYGENYKSFEEVILDSAQNEATARIKLQAKEGDFHRNPFWIDSLGHLAGFVMNANDAVDSSSQVFINHGWDSMRCCKKFSADKEYRTYVKMQLVANTLYAGDVYIFEEDSIVAVYGGVKFLGVPRKVLNSVLPPADSPVTAPKTAARPALNSASQLKKTQPPALQKKSSATGPLPLKSGSSVIVTRALAILAQEIGISQSELTDSASFADFGVDSLLSLTIAGKFREELDLDVESTVFVEYPTVQAIKELLRRSTGDPVLEPIEMTQDASSTGSSTDDSSSGASETSVTDDEMMTSEECEDDDTMTTIRLTLAEEIGVTVDEITPSTNLAEMGMDSLLSLTILGKLREVLGVDLPPDLFAENTSLDAVEAALGIKPKPTAVRPGLPKVVEPVPRQVATIISNPPATSILLQGNPKTASKKLFLFPDGSGSATSYATLPRIASDTCVYGLNCPYMKTPQNLKCSLDELTHPYLAEVRRRQPSGPYYLGGWSAGGICAYDAAQQLIKDGEKVERLILLDSPFPIGLEKLPPRLYAFFDSIGFFGAGDKAPPSWLLPHFLAFIDSLDAYKAVPFAPGQAPQTHVIWAKDGVCKNPEDPRPEPRADDPREMKWLLNNRTDFGPNGWDQLLGGGRLVVETMAGANHFSMMEGAKAKALSEFIGRALA